MDVHAPGIVAAGKGEAMNLIAKIRDCIVRYFNSPAEADERPWQDWKTGIIHGWDATPAGKAKRETPMPKGTGLPDHPHELVPLEP